MTFADEWIADMPQQFRGKKNIEVFIRAIAKQLQEVFEVFEGMNDAVSIDNASGTVLDALGGIVGMTRAQASAIMKGAVITDDVYRSVLRYAIMRNNSDCTYEDIVEAFKLICQMNNVHYSEDVNNPATILLEIDDVDIDIKEDPADSVPAMISPAGVAVLLSSKYTHTTDNITGEIFNDEHIIFDEYTYYDGKYKFDGTRPYQAISTQEAL